MSVFETNVKHLQLFFLKLYRRSEMNVHLSPKTDKPFLRNLLMFILLLLIFVLFFILSFSFKVLELLYVPIFFNLYQSGLRSLHSTETATSQAVCSVFVLLELSTGFDIFI